jgi:hypothetical protein
MSTVGNEVKLTKNTTTRYYTSTVVRIEDDGHLELEGEFCRIVEVAEDGQEVHVDTLTPKKTKTSVQAGFKCYLIRGHLVLNSESSGHKRKREEASASTATKLYAQCWLCEADTELDNCHVIAQADRSVRMEYGVLDFMSSHLACLMGWVVRV